MKRYMKKQFALIINFATSGAPPANKSAHHSYSHACTTGNSRRKVLNKKRKIKSKKRKRKSEVYLLKSLKIYIFFLQKMILPKIWNENIIVVMVRF